MALLLAPQDSVNMAQAQWQELFNGLIANGVMLGQLNTYTVTTTSGLGISVNTGRALIQGFMARSDAAVPLTCAAADPTNPRIDRAVLHADLSAHTLTVILLTGTPAPSPAPPALTQTSTIWEISLYQIRVNATQTTLTGGSLTDERAFLGVVNRGGDTMAGLLTQTRLNSDGGAINTDGAGNMNMTGGVVNATAASNSTVALNAYLPSAPGADQPVIRIGLSGDTTLRGQLYLRSADGYGGFRAGAGASVTAHLYAQASGWKIDEALAVTGNLSTSGTGTIPTLTTSGTGTIGTLAVTNAVSTVGGQATAGSFGVPMIVAQTPGGGVNVTTTTQQTILSLTAPATGLYRVSMSLYVVHTSTITAFVDYFSGNNGSNEPGIFFYNGTNNLNAASLPTGEWGTFPITVYALTGTLIRIFYTDATASPNDHVNGLIERLT